MKNQLEAIIKQIERMNKKLDDQDICGPIPFLEEAIEQIRNAIEDLENY